MTIATHDGLRALYCMCGPLAITSRRMHSYLEGLSAAKPACAGSEQTHQC